MSGKTATERLREMLDERGVAHSDHYLSTTWRDGHGILHLADIKYCERLGFEVGDYGYCAWPIRKD